jgi:hypothetical protein
MLSNTALKAIGFYRGKSVWLNAKTIEAEVSTTGLAFTLKRRPVFEHVKIVMEIGKPFVKLTPIGRDKNITGVLNGNDVHLEDEKGKVIAERKNARNYFPYGRRLFYWDDLDMTYFANYAFWNYFTFPNLLMNSTIKWNEKEEGFLEAIFPDSTPTHSKFQEFKIDMSTGKLLQHNYTVDVFGSWANVANVVNEHQEENGIKYPSRRIVTPRLKDNILKSPVMIDITVHSFKLSN